MCHLIILSVHVSQILDALGKIQDVSYEVLHILFTYAYFEGDSSLVLFI